MTRPINFARQPLINTRYHRTCGCKITRVDCEINIFMYLRVWNFFLKVTRNIRKNDERNFILKSVYVKLSSGRQAFFHFFPADNKSPTRKATTLYVSVHEVHGPSSRRDLSIQFIGAFNRVRGIWFVDDVNDSWMPLLLLSNESSNTRDDIPILPLSLSSSSPPARSSILH